jgi:predicted DsbA family dithiol-disulfide isomerase
MGADNQTPEKRIWSLTFFISLGFSVYSIFLAYISSFKIHSYCLMCIVSYAVNFLLLLYSWIIHQRFETTGLWEGIQRDLGFLRKKWRKSMALMLPFCVVWMVTWASFPSYWTMEPPTPSADLPRGFSAQGHPWIGAQDPELTIVEFTDYRCFQCKKMHFFLRNLLANNPSKIRLVHRHFPMDHEFNPLVESPLHVGSGRLALLSIYAAKHQKFWEMNDILYNLERDNRQINMKYLAQQCNLETEQLARRVSKPDIVAKLLEDIKDGLALGIEGTPGYVINGKVYTAQIPPEILKPYL